MNIAVAGLGYVGSVTAACLTQFGHRVIGVDVSAEKVDSINSGVAPVREPRLDELVAAGIGTKLLSATTDLGEAARSADLIFVCVGTPSLPDGSIDLSAVSAVAQGVGSVLRFDRRAAEQGRVGLVIRSTMPPGSSRTVVLPRLMSGLQLDVLPPHIAYGVQPEFLREGRAVADFFEPPKTVFSASSGWLATLLHELAHPLPGPKFRVGIGEAEMTKYLDNSFHALKVGFANEMARLARAVDLDIEQVFEPFLSDYKLNISDRYLRPGAPFGGSCLPKDIRAAIHFARASRVDVPLLQGLLESNAAHLEAVRDRILVMSAHRVVFLGLAFKSHTDDLRESPFVQLVEAVAAAGRRVVCFDATVAESRLLGVNRHVFEALFRHRGGAPEWSPAAPVPSAGDVLVLCTEHPAHVAVVRSAAVGEVLVVDLTGRYNEKVFGS